MSDMEVMPPVDIALLAPMEPPMDSGESEMDMMEKINTVLDPEEKNILNMAMEDYPELEIILDKVTAVSGEFTGEGPVSGPGTETSDSIPAQLSDGEFVFTAKAVKQIGVDKLRKMMDKAESDYDASMSSQEEAMMEEKSMGGFFLGGLLDKARKFWGSQDTATTTYQEEPILKKPERVDGMGRQVPQGETGMMASRDVNLNQPQKTIASRPEANINQRSMAGTTSTAMAGQMPRASLATDQGREDMQQRLQQATQEKEQPPLMMV